MAGVLDGIRVLDFGRYIAGPFCGTMLGDLGAEVIRIEKLEGSEDRWVTPVVDGGEGAMFLQMGRNKLGLTLNPMKPEGREIVKKLVAVSDVVIANLPYEDLQKMGIDYDAISAINPRIILATTSTFGSEGPYATRVGFDTIGQAMSGAMFLSGDGETPTRMNAPFVDFGTALLNTSVSGELLPLNAQTLRRALWSHPAMTFGVIARIHWQAVRLWIKRAPFFRQPPAPGDFVTAASLPATPVNAEHSHP